MDGGPPEAEGHVEEGVDEPEPADTEQRVDAQEPTEAELKPDSEATGTYPVTPPPVARPAPGPSFPTGRLAFGTVLIGAGVLWLLGALDVVDVPVQTILPIVLMAVGVALVAGARSGRHGGLMTLGVVLTVLLALLSSFDVRLQGGIGQKDEHPITREELETNYRLAVGQLTIDLTDADLPESTTDIHARVGMGQLKVKLPRGLEVIIRGETGAGRLVLFGREASGVNRELSVSTRPFPAGGPKLRLFLTVGLGQIEVKR